MEGWRDCGKRLVRELRSRRKAVSWFCCPGKVPADSSRIPGGWKKFVYWASMAGGRRMLNPNGARHMPPTDGEFRYAKWF